MAMLLNMLSTIVSIFISLWVCTLLMSNNQCKGAELNVVSRRLQNGHLNGRLYVTGKYLIFRLQVLPGGYSDTKEERTAFGYTFVSLGLNPSITIYNSTWIQTFIFDKNTWDPEQGEWKLVLPRSSFSFSDEICEEWMVSVQLDVDTHLLKRRSTLLDFRRVPVLLKDFGTTPQGSTTSNTGDEKFKSCSFGQSACSPDVVIAVCKSENNDFFFGVTHGAFDSGSTSWSRLSFCSTGVQDCEHLDILNVVLSSNHILILTNEGIIAGSIEEDVAQIAFAQIEVTELNWSQWTFFHNPLCSAGRDTSEFEDLVFLLPEPTKNSSMAVGFWSVPPYTEWTPFSYLTHLTPVSWILTGYDLQTNSFITVVQEEELMVEIHQLSVLRSNSDTKTKVPPVPLSQHFQPTGICFHPTTNFFYLYGNQILMSSDGGTSLDSLLSLEFDETVLSCHTSKEDWLVFFTSKGNILFTLAGQKRVIQLLTVPKSSSLIIDALGNLLQVVFKPNYQLVAIPIDIENGIKMSETPLRSTFSVHFLLPFEVMVFEYNGDQLKSMEGRVLKQQSSQNSLLIKKVLPSSSSAWPDGIRSTRATAAVMTDHELNTEFKPYCDLEVTIQSPTLSKMVLHCSNNSTQGWDIDDAGKTIISKSLSLSLLILMTSWNATDAVGIFNLPSPLLKIGNDTPAVLSSTQWAVLDTRLYSKQITPADILHINNDVHTARLTNSSRFQLLPEHAGFQIVTIDGTALIKTIRNKWLADLESETGYLSTVLYPGEWALVDLTQEPQWYFSEDECLHVLQPDDDARFHSVRHLDLGSSFTFTVIASTKGEQSMPNGRLMKVTLSHPEVVEMKTEIHYDQYHSEIMKVTLTHAAMGKGTTALTVSIPAASLRCKDTSLFITFHCTCPPSKHLHFIYSPLFSDDVFLHGHPQDQLNRPLIQDLQVNYRPPSTKGKEIPTSDNIYNADPNATRPQEHYEISKTSGYYKQCFQKMSRSECGCTTELKLSSLAKNSDCRERAHRLIHVGKVTLKFLIRETEKEDIPVREPVAITFTEVNGRIDFDVSAPSTPSLDQMERLALDGIKLLNSTAVLLTLTGSGLYHFKASIAPGFSYCDLQDEFQYYVDLPPLASPTPTIVISAVSLLMGGAFFLWYLQYLGTHHHLHGRRQGMQCTSAVTH